MIVEGGICIVLSFTGQPSYAEGPGRTEADRKSTNEPWSSMRRGQRKRTRPLLGVNGEVRSKNIYRADIVRDVRFQELGSLGFALRHISLPLVLVWRM